MNILPVFSNKIVAAPQKRAIFQKMHRAPSFSVSRHALRALTSRPCCIFICQPFHTGARQILARPSSRIRDGMPRVRGLGAGHKPHRPELPKLPECEKLACRDVFPAHAGTRARKGSRASVHSAKITAGGSPASNAQKQTFCRDSSYSSTWAAPRHGALGPCRRPVEYTCSPVALGRWNRGVWHDSSLEINFVNKCHCHAWPCCGFWRLRWGLFW